LIIISKGDADAAFAEADKVYEEQFETGYQEQAYLLETQGMIADFREGKLSIHGSMQCPYYVHARDRKGDWTDAGPRARGAGRYRGGFGGKEAYPSILACEVAVAAYKAGGKPVRVIFDRRGGYGVHLEAASLPFDLPRRGQGRTRYRHGRFRRLQRGRIYDPFRRCAAARHHRASGVYNVENLKVHGTAMKTNTVPTGAYRDSARRRRSLPLK
jgi:CO/xanthine dehydrogenase Mo-binding subunit